MSIPQGYKQTEVGIIPDDWSIMQLGDIGTFSKGSGISKDESNSGNIPCVRYGEIYTIHDFYIKKYHSFISEDIAKQSKLLKAGDILFAASGETKEDIGKCVAFLSDCKAYAGGDIIILTPKAHSFDSKYLGYILNTSEVAKQKASKGQGDAVVHITTEALADLIVPIPPTIEEQRRIAEVLSDVDGLITALDKKIAKKKLIKQAAMQQLLTGKKRLQGFSDEWTTNKLGDFVKLLNGYAFRSETYSEIAVYKIITIANVQNGKLDMSNYNSIDNLPSDIQRHQRLNIGDVLISMTGNVGRVCIVSENNCLLNQRVGLLEFLHCTNIDDKFLYNVLCSSKFESAMIDCGQGAAQANISKSNIENYTFILPIDTKEQQAIATILSDMDAEISDLERKRDKYKLLKNGIMQKLLTGQIRIL